MLMTANPHADAERHENAKDHKEREREYEAQQLAEQEARSAYFFERALSCEAKAWFTDPVRPYEARNAIMTPDELMAEVLWHENDPEFAEARRLYAVAMTSEAVVALRKEAGRLLGKKFPTAGDLNA